MNPTLSRLVRGASDVVFPPSCVHCRGLVEQERAGAPPTAHLKLIWHPRTLVYLGIWSSIGVAMLFALGERTRLDLNVQHDRNPVYVQLSDGMIRNNYTLKLRNMETRPRTAAVTIEGMPGAVMWTDEMARDKAARDITVTVAPDQVEALRVYVVAPSDTAHTLSPPA